MDVRNMWTLSMLGITPIVGTLEDSKEGYRPWDAGATRISRKGNSTTDLCMKFKALKTFN